MCWYLLKAHNLHAVPELKERFENIPEGQLGLTEIYAPMKQKLVSTPAGKRLVDYPFLSTYMLANAEYQDLYRWVRANESKVHIVSVVSHTEEVRRPLVVPDIQVEMFRRVAEVYDEDCPPFVLTADILAKGDRVKVISGPLKDVEGLLISNRGKDGGRVIVRLSNVLAIQTMEIDPEDIEVKEFAPCSHHLYQKLNSIAPRLELAYEQVRVGKPIPPEAYAAIQVFIRRFSNLSISSFNMRVQFLGVLMQCHLVCGSQTSASRVRSQLLALQPDIRSSRTREQATRALEIYDELAA